ncbi:MAG: hypothetical protein IJX19_11225 [Clostridia bacterium]|nr:hypothetical protein [Clostridia bacterium]
MIDQSFLWGKRVFFEKKTLFPHTPITQKTFTKGFFVVPGRLVRLSVGAAIAFRRFETAQDQNQKSFRRFRKKTPEGFFLFFKLTPWSAWNNARGSKSLRLFVP